MIWRSLTCFSLLGSLLWSAEVSGLVQLQDSREASVRKEQDFSGVVISLEPLDPARLPAITAAHVRMLQKNKTFTPHVLPVRVGTVIDFPNADPIFHNAFSNYDGQIFDVGLYPPGTSRAVKVSRVGVVRVFCNIHPAMSAVIVVLNTPYFAKTDKSGRYSLEVPPGKYEMHVFHERASSSTLAGLSRTVQVGESGVQLTPVVVSEAGYLPAPHNNKFGKPYSSDGDDGSVYPGVRK